MSIRIILADDHQLVRESIRILLEKELGMKVVGEAGDGQTAVRLAREHLPDIVIVDVAMLGSDGIDATKQITSEFPSIKVIALSMYSNKLFVMNMLEAGASGYLLKECTSKELKKAINSVLKNEVYLSPKVAAIVVDGHIRRPLATQSSIAVLTKRECEVLRLLASGKSTKEIAFTLKKSVQTVDACRRVIRSDLGLRLPKFATPQSLSRTTTESISDGCLGIFFNF
jgi:DNA-binding NarL/FixJ family response regulator